MSFASAFPEKTIEWNGKAFKLEPASIATKCFFARYLAKNAIKEVVDLRDSYGDHFAEALKTAQRDTANGYYEWGSKGFAEAIQSDTHFRELAILVLQQSNPGFARETLGEKMWAACGKEIVETIIEHISRPNSRTPEPQATPGEAAGS